VPTVYGNVAFNGDSREFSIRNQGTLKLIWKTGIGTLTSGTAYTAGPDRGNFDFDSSYLTINHNYTKFHNKYFQQSLDYNIDTIDRVDLLVGGLYYKAKINSRPNYGVFGNLAIGGAAASNGNTGITNNATFVQDVKSWAIYIDATYHVTDALKVTAGGRYSHDTKSATAGAQNFAGAFTIPLQTKSVTWTKFTPSAAIRYELAPKTNVYLSYAQGFRNGNFAGSPLVFPNAPPATGVFYVWQPNKPEKIDSFELGFKTAQSTLRFEAAAFYSKYKDIQVNQVIPNPACPTTCAGSNTFSNGPGAKLYGLDLEVTWAATEDLNIHAGAEYLHARYDAYPNAIGTGLVASTLLNAANQVQDWSGKQLARAPNFTANVGNDYTVPFATGS
jgi:iron complex outermembrane receptor protein